MFQPGYPLTHIICRIFSRDRTILNNFMEDARQLYKSAEKKCISIYAADTYVLVHGKLIVMAC